MASRPVTPEIPAEGLLVGWSLEGEPRRRVMGFVPNIDEAAASQHLEPIIHEGEGHLITVAPTGAGKGVGCIIPALLRYKGPVVVVDPKGENYRVTARRRRELGQEVIVLDPFQITNTPEEERGRFNPLDFLSPKNPSVVEDIEMISSILMSTSGNTHSEFFWPFMGGQLLTLLMLYQLRKMPPEEWTLTQTRELLAMTPEEFAKFGETLRKDKDPELRRLAGVASQPADSTFGGYWAFSQLQTAFLKGNMVSECIDSSSFSMQQLVDGDPLSIYIVIPPEKLEAYGNLLKLWLSVMIAALTNRRSKPERPTLFIIDEAAQLGHMPQLRQAITLLRGYGVRVWSFWQDLSQLQGLYPLTWQTILNNSHVQQYFGQVTRLGADQTFAVTGLGSPGFLQTLDRSEMVLSVLGDEPVIAQVPNYLNDPPFAQLYDDNPFHIGRDSQDSIGRSKRVFRRSDFRQDHTDELFEDEASLENDFFRMINSIQREQVPWQRVSSEEIDTSFSLLRARYEKLPELDSAIVTMHQWPLSFHDGWSYCEACISGPTRKEYLWFLKNSDRAILLDGTSTPIHELNQEMGLHLTINQVRDYLYLFVTCVRGDEGCFKIINKVEDLTFKQPPHVEYIEELASLILPLTGITSESGEACVDGLYTLQVTILFGDALFLAVIQVSRDGTVEMLNDDPLLAQIPVVRDTELKPRFQF